MKRLFATVVTLVIALPACGRGRATAVDPSGEVTLAAPTAMLESRDPYDSVAADGPRRQPRLLLTPGRLERVRRHALAGSEGYRVLVEHCERSLTTAEGAGYEGWDWGNRMAECALLWRTGGEPSYASAALRYLRALLEDRAEVGDGRGGDAVVRHDHGYPIRTYAFYAALGYDWLHDAPGMTPELLGRTGRRLKGWLDWYAADGYKREQPIANYFTGYFGALAMSGLAMSGEGEDGDELLRRAERIFEQNVAPVYRERLAGGDWPEGWQYGDGAVVAMALFADGERTWLGRDRLGELPWLRDVVGHHVHALLPDRSTAYDNGDWSARPARMPSRALDVLSMVLPESDPLSRRARFLARELRRPKDDWAWIRLLSDEPDAPIEDPRRGPPSALLSGTGLVLARSDWTKEAVFVSLQCGPTFPDADHQHADQGHFELVRGSDDLLVDPGDYTSFATINHNTLLVDDRGESLDYPPNQGAWGTDAAIRRFVDAGDYVYAAGDLADAYRPSKLEWGKGRSVLKATRALLFLRPATLVIDDKVTVRKASYGVTWVAHAFARPELSPGVAVVRRGGSRATIATLLPGDAHIGVRTEPTTHTDKPYETNNVYAPSFRLEVEAPPGSVERHFLHVVQAAPLHGETASVRLLRADSIDGAVLDIGVGARSSGSAAGRTVVVFVGDPPESRDVRYAAPAAARHVFVGLAPGGRYRVDLRRSDTGCEVRVGPGGDRLADSGGTLVVGTEYCGLR